MAKFLAIGHHGPIAPEDALAIGVRQIAWLEEQIAEGVIEQVWALEGGGRMVIANAQSENDFRHLLSSGPDVPSREWTRVVQIQDGLEVVRDFIDRIRTAAPGDSR
jgi:hypothetical protein